MLLHLDGCLYYCIGDARSYKFQTKLQSYALQKFWSFVRSDQCPEHATPVNSVTYDIYRTVQYSTVHKSQINVPDNGTIYLGAVGPNFYEQAKSGHSCEIYYAVVLLSTTGYGLEGSGIESWGRRDFLHLSTLALGPPPSLLYNGYRIFPAGRERPGRDADRSPPSSAVVKKG